MRILILAAFLAAGTAHAQTVSDVKFQAGNFGTMVSGTITGDGYVDYRLGARQGQKMFVELTVSDSNGNGAVYFNILPPGSDGVAIYNSSLDGNSTLLPLPESGEYVIRVYHMGGDEASGKTSGFNVDLSIQQVLG